MRLHWEDALNRVAAAAAATLGNRDESDNEGANDQKEGNPEHDAGKQVEGLLLSDDITKNDINNLALILLILDGCDDVLSTLILVEGKDIHVINW